MRPIDADALGIGYADPKVFNNPAYAEGWNAAIRIIDEAPTLDESRGNKTKKILDACCGSRMFWYDKTNPNVIFADNRELETTLCDGRKLIIKPDEKIDFRDIPYPDGSFKLVVFDPPHLIRAGENSWLAAKYGVLPEDWREYISQGVRECMRVLEPDGILVFKWCEEQIATKDMLSCIDYKPLLGDKRSKTRWLIFMKGV